MGQQISIHEKTGPGEPAGSLLSFKIPIAILPGANKYLAREYRKGWELSG